MTPERYQLIKSIFFEASAARGEARDALLRRFCGSDTSLRAEVENLLAAQEPDTSEVNVSLKTDAAAAVDRVIDQLQREAPTSDSAIRALPRAEADIPPRIAGYQIERVIGSGGMGTVYAAQQQNPKRMVAVKVMRPGLASRSALRRFEYEAQILANLRHPGIAQIFEAGTADTGLGPQPYFAMELLHDALPITLYAEEKKLGNRERFELMAQVCDAVHHAHQKGVIHRDLKPGNILVDSTGLPKILDFGIAKATDQDMQVTTMHTDVGQLIGTLAYMSPEQVAAKPAELDIRSDVYALGVVLFELLTTRLPYDLKQKALHEAARVIREDEPTPLSTINRIFRGDIETIVQKAMEKDKARRYQSAAELASDLRRYLNNEPIIARPPSRSYQLRKFAQRNRVLVGGVCAVFIALTAGTIVSTWLAVRARSAERATKSEAVRADQTSAFIQTIFDGIDPYEAQGMDTKLLMNLLSKAEGRISKELAEQPLAEAAIRSTLGMAYMNLDRYDEADQNFRRSEELYVRQLGNNHERTARTHIRQVHLLVRQGKHEEARGLALSFIPGLEQSLGKNARETLDMRQALGKTLVVIRNDLEAQLIQRDVLARSIRVFGERSREAAEAMDELAFTLSGWDKADEAAQLMEKSVDIQTTEYGPDDARTLVAKSQLAMVKSYQGRFEEAIALYQSSISGLTAVLGPQNSQALNVMNNLGAAFLNAGRYLEAEETHRRTYEARRQVLGETHSETLLSQNNLARTLHALGRFEEAESLFRHVLKVRKQTLGDDHGDTLSTLHDLAFLMADLGRDAECAALMGEKVASFRRQKLESHPNYLISLYNWAAKLQDAGDLEAAAPLLQEVLALEQKHGKDYKSLIAAAHNALAKCLESSGDREGADVHFLKAMEMRRSSSDPYLVLSLADYGGKLMDRGNFTSAEPYLREHMELAEKLSPPDPAQLAIARVLWGRFLTHKGVFREAEAALMVANDTISSDENMLDAVVIGNLKRLAELYEAWDAAEPNTGKAEQAAQWRAKLQAFKSERETKKTAQSLDDRDD